MSAGANLTYTINVTNLSTTTTATGVSVSDPLPASTTLVSATGSAGVSCTGTTTVNCSVPNLSPSPGPGHTATITIVVTTGCTGPLSNTATVSSTTTDPDSANDTATATTTVNDTTAPTFTAPANATIFKNATCGYDASVGVTGDVTDEADNCDTTLNATFTDVVTAGSCEGEQIITRTWSLTDDASNTTTHDQIITAKDNTAPSFTVPANATVYKDASCAYNADPTVTGDVTDEADNCDTSLNATYTDVVAAGTCQGEQVITRTWSLTDDCGNNTTQVQTITAKDNTAPTFSAPANTTIYKDAACAYNADPSVTGDVTDEADNCDTSLNASYTDVVAAGSCEGEQVITRTWSLTDDCGNNTHHVQTITAKDNTAPTFTAPASTTIYADASCNYDASVAATGDVTNEADNCSTNLQASFTDSVAAGSCEGEKVITRTWTLSDNCGNAAASQVQTITVKDNTAPTFTAPASTTIYADASCNYDASVAATGDVTNEADNCSTNLQASFTDSVAAGSCEGEKVITRTWSLSDNCGNAAASQVQTITVKDNTAPSFTVPANATVYKDATCAYNADPTVTGDVTDEADNCDTSLNATYTDVVAAGTCQGEQVITRTWSLTDDCGNNTTQVQTITAKDNTAPTFSAPANTTIYKDAACAYNADPSVTGDVTDEADNCDTSLNATYADVVAAGSCQGEEIITRTWSLTDDCGNNTQHVQTITAKDNTAPTFTAPASTTIYADASCNYDAGVGVPAMSPMRPITARPDLQASFTDSVAAGSCEGEKVITRTWTLSDNCGNAAASQVQTITVKDNTAPTFTAPASTTIYADASCNYDASVAATGDVTNEADNCSTNLQASFTDSVAAGTCEGEKVITRTWSLSDNCGNAAASQVQTITVKDNTAPSFTVPANATVYKDATCAYNADPTVTGDVTDEADNCDTSLNATYTDVVAAGTCQGEQVITRTWSLTDDCGNNTTQVQTITAKDNTAPTFSAPANTTIYKDAACAYNADPSITGDVTDEADNCDTSLNATYTDVVAAGSCEGEQVITRTWSLTDDCGNNTQHVQTITAKDNTAPTFTAPASTTIYADASCNYDASVAATGDVTNEADNCSTNLQASFTDSVAAGSCEGEQVITRTWTLSDNCGNAAASQVQTITVKDNTAPTFTAPASTTIYADASCNYDASVAATGDVTNEADNCSTNLQASFTDSVAAGSCEGEKVITRTWSLSDNCGNAAASQVQTITVKDNTAPSFTVPANATVYKDATCAYNADPTVTGDVTDEADNCDTSLNATYTDVVAAGTCQGEQVITRTWSLTDDCGNNTTQVQTITAKDNTAPTFSAPANTTIYKDAACAYNADPSITGDVTDEADNCDTSLNASYTDVVAAGSCEGEQVITRTWSLTDDCGNNTTQVQTITAKDNTAPTFTAPASTTIYADASCNYDASVAATGDVTNEADNCSTNLQASFTDSVAAGSCEGEQVITRTWTLSDNCGNAAASQVQTITVKDNTAPTFTAPASTTIYADASCNYDASVAATGDVTNEADNCSTNLQASFTDSVAAGSCEGEKVITRTWSLSDNCGNAAASQVQTITVKDNTAPSFTVPANATVYKDATCAYNADPTVTGDVTDEADNCDTSLNATYTDVVAAGTCQGEQVITRTWSLTDDCGNNTTQVQTITAKDNTAPTFSAPANTTIYKDAACAYNADPSVTGDVTDEADNCDTSLNATYTDVVAAGSCEGEEIITRTWSLTDDCGNNTQHVQTITAKDNTAPTFTAPASTTIYADASCNYDAGVGVTGDVTNEADNCSTGLQASFTDAVAAGTCEGEKVITRTWSLSDNCGNAAASQVQTITVKDNTAPTFTAPASTTIYADASCNYDASVAATGDVTNEADNCSTNLQASFTDSVAAGSCEGEKVITRTWSLSDNCGNAAASQVQTITVKDNTAPSFTVPANATVYKDATCAYNADPTVTGDVTDEADNCDTSLNATYTDVVAAGTCQGEQVITRTWSLTDDCGNNTTHVQTITAKDNTAPTFTAPANTTIYKDAACAYNADPSITGDVTDEADNCDTSLNATYTDVVAAGSCEGEQIITRTWSLTDDCGNNTTQVQTITAKDNTAPTFTAPASTTIYADASCNYDASVAATGDVTNEADNCSTNLQASFTDSVAAGSCEGEKVITRTWTLSDNCGNAAASQVQTITVKDNTAPTFTAPASTTIYADASCNYDASVAATGDVTNEADNCSTNLQASFTDSVAAGSCEGEKVITRTWSLSDNCGNAAASQVQTITVKDNTAPSFTVPANATVYKDASCAYNADPTVTGDVTDEADNCDTSLNATYTDVVAAGTCQGEQVITRTWSLTDDCGNNTTQVQTITAKDNTAPTFSAPANTTIYKDAACAYNADPSITGDVTDEADNCDTSLNASYTDVVASRQLRR